MTKQNDEDFIPEKIENFNPELYKEYKNQTVYLSILDILAPIGLVLGFIAFGIVMGLMHAV